MSISNGYCSRAELIAFAFATITDVNDPDNANLDLAVESVSRWIDAYCQRRFWKDGSDTTRTYEATCGYELEVDDIVSITTLKTDAAGDGTYETTLTSGTDYQLLPLNPLEWPEQYPYTKIRMIGSQTFPYTSGYGVRRDNVQITGVFGWPAVPSAVKQACLIQSARMFKRKDSPEGVLGGFQQFEAVRVGTRLDPDVAQLLAAYRKYPVMVA